VNFGVPMAVGVLAAWTLMAEFDLRSRALDLWTAARDAVIEQPRFTIREIAVPDVSPDLAEQIRIAAFVPLPVSSLEVNVGLVRSRVESLAAVERARVRALASGVLEIRAIERVPVLVWRTPEGVQLLDKNGVRVAEVDSRLRRPDLPLIAGEGASAHVPEALALLDVALPVLPRIRGLVRVGERRWDVVLDRDQVISLPEEDAVATLERVMALHVGEDLLGRDLSVVDMRDPRRPMLRLNEHAAAELIRLRTIAMGEDA
jgi:cell division protein FtsQ